MSIEEESFREMNSRWTGAVQKGRMYPCLQPVGAVQPRFLNAMDRTTSMPIDLRRTLTCASHRHCELFAG